MINLEILPIILAGIVNGSFVTPVKYIKHLSRERIWFYHSLFGCAILPWIMIAILFPKSIVNYPLLDSNLLYFLIIGGVVFGIGQVCFAMAIETIGIALSFAINLGIGVTIGSMFVVFNKGVFFTTHGYVVTIAVILILFGLTLHYFSEKHSQKNQIIFSNSRYRFGSLLALAAGITSGLQNVIFITLISQTTLHFQSNNTFWVWPPFLLAASVPMMIGFFYRANKNKIIKNSLGLSPRNICLIALMGLSFTGSLVLYSYGMGNMGQVQIIGWPAFMISIILTSQVWGAFYKENNNVTGKAKLYQFLSIVFLVVAIVILAIES